MLSLAVVCLLLIITPGPGVLCVAGVRSGFGFAAGRVCLLGLCIHNMLVCIAVVSGLAAAIVPVPHFSGVLLILSIDYMVYLAMKAAFANVGR